MKNFCLCIAIILMITTTAPAIVQENSDESQEVTPALKVTLREIVNPSMADDYETGTTKLMELLKAQDVPFPVFAWQGADGSYSYTIPVTSMGQIDEFSKYWTAAAVDLRNSEWGQKRQAAITGSRYTIWMEATDLSYVVEKSELADEEAIFLKFITFRTNHTNEAAFRECLKKMKIWSGEAGLNRSYWVYRNIVGEDGPLYLIVMPGKDPADYFNSNRALMRAHGRGFFPIKMEIDNLGTYISESHGYRRDDLSLMQ